MKQFAKRQMPGDAFPPEREKLVVVLHWKLTQIFNASTLDSGDGGGGSCSCCPFRLSFSIVKVSVCCVAVAAHREVLSQLSQLVCGSNYPAQYSAEVPPIHPLLAKSCQSSLKQTAINTKFCLKYWAAASHRQWQIDWPNCSESFGGN